MQNLRILNNKEVRKILKEIEEHFGSKIKLDYAFLQNNEGKIFLISRKFGDISPKKLRINSLGLYFGKVEKSGIRLSIEGSQLVKATKNVIELDEKQLRQWMLGKDIEVGKHDIEGYVVVKHKNDSFGCGAYKEGKLLNFVPKSRRLTSKIIE